MSTRKNAGYNVAYRMFSVLLPLVIAPYLSRTVGTDGVGLYSKAWSISYIFCLIGMLGLNDYGVRTVAQVRDDRKELDRTFSAIWQMQLLVAGATLLAWLGYVFLAAGEEKLISFHLTMMSVSCLCSFDWCLMGMDQFKPIALRNTAVKIIATICVFIFVRGKEDLWVYAFAWSLSTLLGNLSCAAMLKGRVRYRPVPLKESLKHLRPCAVLFISVMAVSIYRTMDKVMVSVIAGVAENGLYEKSPSAPIRSSSKNKDSGSSRHILYLSLLYVYNDVSDASFLYSSAIFCMNLFIRFSAFVSPSVCG